MEPHPHADGGWIYNKGRAVDAWWDRDYGPDGNYRHTGPLDDEMRPVLVLNTGLTRQQYVDWNPDAVSSFICQASHVGATDIWVDLEPPLNRYPGNTLLLCKSDTLPSERDELHVRGFTYLGSRGDLMYFVDPFGSIDIGGHTDTYYEVPRVRIIIHRDACMCSAYHKERDAWDWSRVGFDGIPPRAPPVQPPETAEEIRAREEQRQEAIRIVEQYRQRANDGDDRARFLMDVVDMQRSMKKAADEEAIKSLFSKPPK